MRKIILIVVFASTCLLNIKCSSTPENQAPSAVNLQFPTQDLLCIDNTIDFNWSDTTDPESDPVSYNLIIASDRALTNVVENRTVSTSQLSITLEKETAYYWKVDALDTNNNLATSSSVYAFYTKGEGTVNYAPFTSELLTPTNNGQVSAGSLNLTWNASDTNTTDTLTYEVFFGENSTLTMVAGDVTAKTYAVTVETGKTYSWKINVADQHGAKSIGEVWTFTVN